MLRFACARGAQNIRPLKFSTRLPVRVRARKTQQTENIFENAAESELGRAIPGYSTGAKVAAGCSALGLGALIYNGLNPNDNIRSVDKALMWPAYVKERIASSYSYLFNGLLVSGVATYGVLRSPRLMALATRGGFGAVIATIAGMIGLQIATRSIPYEPEGLNLAKHGCFAAHAAFMSVVIAPMVAMYGDVVAQAALYTAGIVGGISAVGWTAPSNEFMKIQGPLAMCFGACFIAAMASPFFNPMSGPGGALFSFLMWGGLIFAGVGVFTSTQRMIHKAEHHPSTMFGGAPFDPINASLGLYIDTIMIFQRLLFILGNSKRK